MTLNPNGVFKAGAIFIWLCLCWTISATAQISIEFNENLKFEGRGAPERIVFEKALSFEGRDEPIEIIFDKPLVFRGRGETIVILFDHVLSFQGRVNNDLERLKEYRKEIAEITELFGEWYTSSNMAHTITNHKLAPEKAKDPNFITWLNMDEILWHFYISEETRLRSFMYSHLAAIDSAIEDLTSESDLQRVKRLTDYFTEHMPQWRIARKKIEVAYFECMLNRQLSAYKYFQQYQIEYATNYWGEARQIAYDAHMAERAAATACVSSKILNEIASEPAFEWPIPGDTRD